MHCTGVGVWEEKLALVPAAPCGPALSHQPLWLIQGVFLFLFPLSKEGRDTSAPALTMVQAEALTQGRHRAPSSAPDRDS